jgi:hypothetical protein
MTDGSELTPEQEALAARGRGYLDALTPGLTFGAEAIPADGAVYVWQLGFGGSQILVGDDGTLLFGTSALSRDAMLASWRAGRRTPATDLDAAAAQRRGAGA